MNIAEKSQQNLPKSVQNLPSSYFYI